MVKESQENEIKSICNNTIIDPSLGEGRGGYLIGAATSNSGKTTFTMGLLRALRDKGLKVQPYKCGPDYIDTMFHEIASGRESVNLDTYMASDEHVKEIFQRYGEDADVRIVEGVMGLYDGYDKSKGSSADIAMLLDIPVILVVNAKSVAYSVAPLIYGFKHFNPKLKIAGVVFNMVASENHFSFLKQACEDAGVPCLGYMLRNRELIIPGRHLGLTIEAREEAEELIRLAAKEVEEHVGWPLPPPSPVEREPIREREQIKEDKVSIGLSPSGSLPTEGSPMLITSEYVKSGGRGRVGLFIAIAKDSAFNFTYRANIDALRELGEVTFFSPMNDERMPECDLLYLPGGYPELFASELADNVTMRESIKAFAERGGRIFAECGGFMYLCNDIDGIPMCGVFPFSATMMDARLHLGYRQLCNTKLSTLNSQLAKGHEFHYSSVIEPDTLPEGIRKEQFQLSAKGQPVDTALYHYKNVLAGYTHWYWAETGFAELLDLFKCKDTETQR